MAIYAIGDVQGCYDSLIALIGKLPIVKGDQIWLCGDLVNRGPKSAEVLRWAMGRDEVRCVLGNHDLHLLAAAKGARKAKARDTLHSVLLAPDCEKLLNWLSVQPLLYREGPYSMVHAGLHPAWSLEQSEKIAAECQEAISSGVWLDAWKLSRPNPPKWSWELEGEQRLAAALSVLVGVRVLTKDGQVCQRFSGPPSQRPANTHPWFQDRTDEGLMVFGHWAALGVYQSKHHVGLDSGCVWGGSLTAMRLEDRMLFSQPALEVSS